jgi:hypothetical protein
MLSMENIITENKNNIKGKYYFMLTLREIYGRINIKYRAVE